MNSLSSQFGAGRVGPAGGAPQRPDATQIDVAGLTRRLRAAVSGEVRDDAQARALYSTDASVYRQIPQAVVLPRHLDDVVAAIEVCRAFGAAVLPRGAGTSIAGQGCNEAVVIDTRQVNRILEIDPDRRAAWVEPGVVLDDLRAAARPHGLTFGPDPSTHDRCTIGGMIGNNACGTHSVAWGKTVDNVLELDALLYDGTRLRVGPREAAEVDRLAAGGDRGGRLYSALRALRERHLVELRTAFPDLPRRVSGYNLDQLLPERRFNLARALVGTEGTCATTLRALVRLVDAPAARALLVLGFDSLAEAADAVPAVLRHQPVGLEGMGRALVDCLAGHRTARIAELLPPGQAWLLAEFPGGSAAEATAAARRAGAALRCETIALDVAVHTDPARQRALWQVREEGAGLASRMPDGSEAWAGWEDAAVPPARLGDYIRAFDALLAEHGRRGVPYGHFGDGCLHVRIDFDLLSPAGVAGYRRFLEDAADLVVRYGGSLSGEHGDGQMRAELLPRMYSPAMIGAFEAFKEAFDPDDRMNPGKIVRPRPLDADLRLRPTSPAPLTVFSYPGDHGDFAAATRRCIGVGKCLRTDTGVMCPSYMVTRQERDSTRGRARLLFEMLQGEVITDGWRSAEVRDALDLCLACKGCRSDCPVEVDMATYKAEFLSHYYAGRIRPASHYAMGWLPLWVRLGAAAPRLVNQLASGPTAPLLRRLAGVDPRRPLPTLATETLRSWLAERSTAGPHPVVLWPDTFTNFLQPQVGRAAVAVLENAGLSVRLPPAAVCCGLPWISTGQLGVARAVLRRAGRVLAAQVSAGLPIVGLEPSCTAVLRSDALELLPDDPHVSALARHVRTFAELLAAEAPHWRPRQLPGRALVQRHCHQHAVLGHDADDRLLALAVPEAEVLDSGCCGLAGNFGFERGHYEVSMACAERRLLPAVRQAPPDTLLIADGFSCRTQILHGTGQRALHLAEVLQSALG